MSFLKEGKEEERRGTKRDSNGEIPVVVLGAGVIGLTTALLLSLDKNNKFNITIVAKHMPGDYDIEYASPWAGANYLPISKENTDLHQYEKDTWPPLSDLAQNHPEAGVHFQNTILWNRKKDSTSTISTWQRELLRPDPWYKNLVPNFRTLPKHELKPGMDSATSFTSVCINTAIYLPWLASQCLKNGVKIRRGIVGHVSEAAEMHDSGERAEVVVNCTGLGSRALRGVQDAKVVPARGQIVVVRNDPRIMTGTSGTDDGDEEACYIMHRAAGGGTILGGCYQKGNWESQPDLNLATRIMKRSVDLCPELTDGKGIEALSIVRHGVGLRPVREGGPRVEAEKINGVNVVHHYGHGGGGYQASWGSAQAAVRLVGKVVSQRSKL